MQENQRYQIRKTILTLAKQNNVKELDAILSTTSVPLDIVENALCKAACEGATNVVRLLVEKHGASPTTKAHITNLAIETALRQEHFSIAEFLIQRGREDINSPTGGGSWPLLKYAAAFVRKGGSIRSLELLLQYGAEFTALTFLDMSFLTQMKTAEATKLLLRYGADVNQKTKGKSMLKWSILNDDMEKFHVLLEAGMDITDTDIDFVSRKPFSTLEIAATYGKTEKFQALMEYGASRFCPLQLPQLRDLFIKRSPDKADQFDEAVVQASFTLRHNKKVLGRQIFYWYRLSSFGDLPIEVSVLVAEYTGVYGQRFDTGETAVLRALVERKETGSSGTTETKMLKQSDSPDESMTEESQEAAEDEDSNKSGSEKADAPSEANDNTHNESDNTKKESKNMDILSQLQQQDDTPFELNLPETNTQKMKKEIQEDALIERSQKDRKEIEQELEDRQEVKAPNILNKENTEEEEENTNKNPETSMPEISNKLLYPPIPEEGVVEAPAPIISDPSFTGSGAITFAISFGIFCIHHGEKHLHGEVPVPDLPDFFA